jgi:hypothetical protein
MEPQIPAQEQPETQPETTPAQPEMSEAEKRLRAELALNQAAVDRAARGLPKIECRVCGNEYPHTAESLADYTGKTVPPCTYCTSAPEWALKPATKPHHHLGGGSLTDGGLWMRDFIRQQIREVEQDRRKAEGAQPGANAYAVHVGGADLTPEGLRPAFTGKIEVVENPATAIILARELDFPLDIIRGWSQEERSQAMDLVLRLAEAKRGDK